jgi:predicted Zn-dependent protease
MLQRLKDRLYPLDDDDKNFSITLQVADNAVVNAYAGLGGVITLNAGLLDEAHSAEEVAGVLAHEIEHVHRRHILEGALTYLFTTQLIQFIASGDFSSTSEWAHSILQMGFSRAKEAEADEGALKRLQKANIDNTGFAQFFDRMKNEETMPTFLSDHPSSKSRHKHIQEFHNQKVIPIMAKEEWQKLKSICR